MAAAVPHGGARITSVIPAGHLASVGEQKGSAWVQPFLLCDFRFPSCVNHSSSVQTGERLELVGCISTNHLLKGCMWAVLVLYE